LSCIYGGMVTGPAMATWRDEDGKSAFEMSSSLFESEQKRRADEFTALGARTGAEFDVNPYQLHEKLGNMMLTDVTVERHNGKLDEVLATLSDMQSQWKRCKALDGQRGSMNQPVVFLRHLKGMLDLAQVIAQGARVREECRGAHYKPALDPELHPDDPKAVGRDDAHWLKTTRASYTPDGPKLSYEEVDVSLEKLAKRDYGKVPTTAAAKPAAEVK
jgi:succinate dehydrogenase / fumarate reductase flavoprotein subunit